ncbi:acyl-CoA thioesterase [Mariniluteicoccus flavus]
MSVVDEMIGARRTLRRHLTWAETDAAGHNHFSAAVRWLEEGEHDLWRDLGLVHVVPRVPRVHIEIDFSDRIFFGDAINVTTGILRVGGSSATFGTSVTHPAGPEGPERLAIECRHVVAYCPDPKGRSERWPDGIRALLLDPSA